MQHLFARLFNVPSSKDAPFLLDKVGRKFWVYLDEEDLPYRISLGFRGKPAGYAYLLWREGHVELGDILIFRQYRHHGVGSAFFQFLVGLARKKGARFVYGRMQPEEGHSLEELAAWYEKQGARIELNKRRFVLTLDDSD